MTTQSDGTTVLCTAFGSIKKIDLDNSEMTIDNSYVVTWSSTLDYDIHLENGFWQSIGTGEGVFNTFKGSGSIYVQSLNLEIFVAQLGGDA
ncbi:biogenesis AIM24 [Ligilactobacillus sp. WC1T17]|uniref:Biogenesis AIM24 n=1 Tax=Ligilactobacillus ruminis TaxID=1623 RepID=A0ABY1AA13_9LACO|nr:biogenesis AIM24 [Ligilactobacillus ruminis]